MNRWILKLTSALFLASTSFAFAAGPSPTPAVSHAFAPANPAVHQFNMRLRNQFALIMQGQKSQKLNKTQVTSLRASLKAARLQEVGYFKSNGSHTLTSDQINQLNEALNQNSSTLGETPVSTN